MAITRLNPEYQPKGSYAAAAHSHPASQVTGLGDVVSDNVSTAVSVATSTWKTIGSVTLAPGTWVVAYSAQWAANSTGRRRVMLSNNKDASSTSYQRLTGLNQLASSGNETVMNGCYVHTLSTERTLHLNVWQNTGGSLECSGLVRAVRIK